MQPDNFNSSITKNQIEQPKLDSLAGSHGTVTDSQTKAFLKSPKKSKKKLIIISGVALIFICLVGFVANEQRLAQKYDSDYKKYVISENYKGYAKDLNSFLNDNDSLMARMYTCSATSKMIWDTSNLLDGGTADMKYIRQQNQIRNSWGYAKKSQPNYHNGILAGILPQAKKANQKHDTLTQLFGATEKMINTNDLTDYCVRKLYYSIVTLDYMKKYTDTHQLVMTAKSDVDFELQFLAKLKNDALVSYIKAPQALAGADATFKDIFLTKLQIDLTTLQTIKKNSPIGSGDFGALNTSFTSDIAGLDSQVLAVATEAGKKITPSPDTLKNLLSKASNN